MGLLADESTHFLLAFSVGWLGFLLTSTTLSVPFNVVSLFSRWRVSTAVKRGIFICSLLLAISLALLSHYYLDLFQYWYTAPLVPGWTPVTPDPNFLPGVNG